MSKLVPDVAQMIQDSFEQSFAPQDSFFKDIDYQLRVVDARDSMLKDEFLVQWKYMKQRGLLYSQFIYVSPLWLKRITIEIKEDKERKEFYGEICEPLFEFPYDDFGYGIQDVAPYGQKCGEFVRILNHQRWQTCLTATSPVILYSIEGCRIYLHNFDGSCTEKLDVRIVPSQSNLPINKQTCPDGSAEEIREIVISKMWRDYSAKLGKVNMTNDGNVNPQPNESGAVYSDLKTK